jgi:hypothetical protein
LRNLVVRSIVHSYDIYPTIVMDKDLDVKAMYIPEEDKMIIKDIEMKEGDAEDFMLTILHECKHALDAKRIGVKKFVRKYCQAGTMAVHCGRDPYDDNKWEISAEKWAKQEFYNNWRNNDISEEDKK